MKKNYHLDDFESFLSDSADQHRMYPSDRVWRNIDKELHGQKKWPALTFGALFTGAIITAGLILIHPDKNLLTIDPQSIPQKQANGSTSVPSISGSNSANAHRPAVTSQESGENNTASTSSASIGYYDFNDAGIAAPASTENALNATGTWPPDELSGTADPYAFKPLSGVRHQGSLESGYPNAGTGIAQASVEGDEFTTMTSSATVNSLALTAELQSSESLPAVKADSKKSRWGMEYYFTPSYSYRYLTETKITDLHQTQQNNGPIAPNVINPVNNFVSHKPILGIEFGTGVVYQASSKLQVKAGLQFNMRGYSIDAYAARVEPSTIVLNRGYYTDSIFAMSSYSTQSGYKEATIENRYWQISMPIGLNYQVTNGKKLNLHIAASLQPTYQFTNSEYILSHDYRNYVEEPSLVRRWNVNTALGALMTYQTKGLTWQAGPQLRYQALSGTVSEYPIQEHLIDYGFKIGVVKTLK